MTATSLPMVEYLVLEPEPHLRATVCDDCGAQYFDRRNACASCGGRSFHPQDLGTTGTVRSFSIISRAAPGVPAPFVSAVVDLDGGGRVKANLVGVDPTPDAVHLGMKVALTTFVAGTDDRGTEAVGFGFSPA
jgi:uncharacterized OB-fold protein